MTTAMITKTSQVIDLIRCMFLLMALVLTTVHPLLHFL